MCARAVKDNKVSSNPPGKLGFGFSTVKSKALTLLGASYYLRILLLYLRHNLSNKL